VPLIAGRRAIVLEPDIAARAAGRCDLEPFEHEPSQAEPAVRLHRGHGAAPPEALALGAGGRYQLSGPELRVWISGDPLSAEAAVRAAFAVAFELQGGVLVHAAGISLGGRALLAAGESGAGKSTLAQCCAGAGLGLEVLSDETIGALPDGTLWATPFRSSARYVVEDPRQPRALHALAFLEHAPEERLVPLGAADATARLLRQIYPGPVHGAGDRLRRAATLAKLVPPAALRLRRHPEVAAFVRELLGGGR